MVGGSSSRANPKPDVVQVNIVVFFHPVQKFIAFIHGRLGAFI